MDDTTAPIQDVTNKDEMSPFKRWQTELDYSHKELKKFHNRGRRVVRRYLDDRDAVNANDKWFNLFHANTKILRAALYAQLPQPTVKRKYLDYTDQVARVAANILQRVITPDADDPRDLFDATMRGVVFDRLVAGLGTAWLRIETETEERELSLESTVDTGETAGEVFPNMGFETGPAPDQQAGQQAQQQPQPGQPTVLKYTAITAQHVVIDYVYWEDLAWSPCRTWEERRWVARRVYMQRDELVKRFGEKIGKAIPLNSRPKMLRSEMGPQITPEHQVVAMAEVWEIWDRTTRKIIWFCRDYPQLLDEKEDFLQLIGFEPCPKPLLANVSTSNTVPRPDYYMTQDQYMELDTVNDRISRLIQACKVAGVYDSSASGIQRLLQEGTDNILIPVDNWALFAEKGGVKGQIDWLPLDQVLVALKGLYDSRESIKQQVYELTGISDIVRGATKASETLGAQQLKAQFASVRIKDLQDEVAQFAASILRIKAELMVKHFAPDILMRMSNAEHFDQVDQQLVPAAISLLKSEEGFEWRIEVTSDQLAQADYAAQKQDRVELLTSVGQYMSQIQGAVQAAPQLVPLFVQMLKWAVAGFKGAREIEGFIDQQLDSMLKMIQEAQNQPPQPPKPSPAEMQAQADAELKQKEFQLNAAARQQEMQFKQQEHAFDMQSKQQQSQLDLLTKLRAAALQDGLAKNKATMKAASNA